MHRQNIYRDKKRVPSLGNNHSVVDHSKGHHSFVELKQLALLAMDDVSSKSLSNPLAMTDVSLKNAYFARYPCR